MSSDKELIKKLNIRLDKLESEIIQLKKQNLELENRLRQYEGPNSPSSSKPLFKKEKQVRKPSGKAKTNPRKRKGREKGHEGSTLVLESNRESHDYVSECHNCHSEVDLNDQQHIYSYQMVDLPKQLSVDIVTHHVYEARCECCGEKSSSDKQEMKGSIFGAKLASFLSLLFYKGRIPLRGISSIIDALTGYEFSASTISNCLMTVADNLEEPVNEIKTIIENQNKVHIDETGYISNIDKREIDWIWSFSTPHEVYYEFRNGRSSDELKEIWSPDPGGTTAIVDGWSAYNFFPRKQRCWAHVIRESRDLATRRGGVMDAAHEQFSALFHKISRFKEMRPESRNPIIWHDALIELEEIIELISSDCREDVQLFGRKLSNAKSDLLRALQQPELPLTNNHAERCLRPLVIHRKIRGFVASDRGKQTL
ncbi:MAG: IS66 family transposase, partial [Candidatus Heimdallarchaeota archaeon]|nr:IS66 family transposase [Candidatus Heimdallarchaeota archaeon]